MIAKGALGFNCSKIQFNLIRGEYSEVLLNVGCNNMLCGNNDRGDSSHFLSCEC